MLLFRLPICCAAEYIEQEDNRIARAREAQEKKRHKQQIDHLATQVKVGNTLPEYNSKNGGTEDVVDGTGWSTSQ